MVKEDKEEQKNAEAEEEMPDLSEDETAKKEEPVEEAAKEEAPAEEQPAKEEAVEEEEAKPKKKKEEVEIVEERTYTIPLQKALVRPPKKRAPRAMQLDKDFHNKAHETGNEGF